jgi:hypothetical protein
MWLDITDAIRQIIQLEETNITPQQQHNDEEEEEEEVEVEEPQQKKTKPSFLARMDDEMDAASTLLTRDQVLHAEITTFRMQR